MEIWAHEYLVNNSFNYENRYFLAYFAKTHVISNNPFSCVKKPTLQDARNRFSEITD